jgi:hypothetical protein
MGDGEPEDLGLQVPDDGGWMVEVNVDVDGREWFVKLVGNLKSCHDVPRKPSRIRRLDDTSAG